MGLTRRPQPRRLNALEAQLGAVLFSRAKSGLTPTEAGSAMIKRATEMDRWALGISDGINEAQNSAVGTVRLIGNAWSLDLLARSALPRLSRDHPRLSLHLVGHHEERPIVTTPTLSLWFETPPRDIEFAIQLGDVAFAVYAARGGDPTKLPFVALFDEQIPRRATMRTLEKLGGDRAELAHTATDAVLVAGLIRAGTGKGLLPMCLATEFPELERVTSGRPELDADPECACSSRHSATGPRAGGAEMVAGKFCRRLHGKRAVTSISIFNSASCRSATSIVAAGLAVANAFDVTGQQAGQSPLFGRI